MVENQANRGNLQGKSSMLRKKSLGWGECARRRSKEEQLYHLSTYPPITYYISPALPRLRLRLPPSYRKYRHAASYEY
eukprot:scaffold5399_cov147-Skeletonema_menzelii.AAC.18